MSNCTHEKSKVVWEDGTGTLYQCLECQKQFHIKREIKKEREQEASLLRVRINAFAEKYGFDEMLYQVMEVAEVKSQTQWVKLFDVLIGSV